MVCTATVEKDIKRQQRIRTRMQATCTRFRFGDYAERLKLQDEVAAARIGIPKPVC